ncbi:MAG TPA: c-type cytochrome [Kofleriaceae bacterium]|jgi:mono/diheme cytochrome c family protein|nr:c-type cytochrome [Kofleriaceae bacterium]
MPIARVSTVVTSLLVAAACGGKPSAPPAGPTPAAAPPVNERGGRVFDQWRRDPGAREVALDKAPHDWRLKNLYGWDLRGAAGVYGPKYQAKPYVLARDWLAGTETVEQIVAILKDGDPDGGQPPFGPVLDDAALTAVATFIVDVRDGRLARPDWIWTLSEGTPGNYVLNPGADPARGAALFAERCSGCHGDDGTEIAIDDGEFTLGTHARQKAYEDWIKILNGQPGTEMGRQVVGPDGRAMAQEILDLLAALCDRTKFPRGAATGDDVADGDPRCGAYLR